MVPRKSLSPEERAGFDPSTFPTFCRRVRERRIVLEMTLEQFGQKVQMTKQGVSNMEGGKFPRDHDRIIAIADALGVSLDWLFGRRDEP